MSDSTTMLDLINEAQAGKATSANDLFDAASPAMLYGRRASATAGLTWGYYGGRTAGVLVSNGTVSLTASATNYVVANLTTGAVSVATTTTNWDNDTDYRRLYKIVTGSAAVVSYEDHREASGNGGGSSSFTGGALTSALDEAKGTNIASAATTNIGAATGNLVHITGTTTITALGTVQAGTRRVVVFDGVLTLTHNATSLILPTGANITTAAGDIATFVSEGSGNWRCAVYQRASGAALSSSGGGLTNWTDSISTSSPNASTPVASLTASNAATNVDVALSPKGSGSILAHVPDGTTARGNKRGSFSIDLQMSRDTAAQVASGIYAITAGGRANTASTYYCSVLGGNGNSASSNGATIGGGQANAASGSFSTILGGAENTASGLMAACGGGTGNVIDGAYSSILGGQYGSTRGIRGSQAHASGRYAATGDAQRRRFILRRATSDATVTVLDADGSAPSTTTQVVLPNASAFHFSIRIVARSTADEAAYLITGLIKRGASAGTTALVGTPTVTVIGESAGASSWDAAVSADTTIGALKVEVTGAASTGIKWVADVETVEVVG